MASKSGAGWQDNVLTVQESFTYMYKHGIFGDVTIQATDEGKGTTMCFSAHKIALAVRSAVFADMFYKKTAHTSNIIISLNINPRAFDIFLWYIYSDVVEGEDIEELIESFDVGVDYKVFSFCMRCAEKLQELSSDISANNVWSVLKIANRCSLEKLRSTCFQFIKKEPERAFLSENFVIASEEAVMKILKVSNLNLCPKSQLKIMINWMLHNGISDRKFLSNIDLAAFKADDFLNIIKEFPTFFSGEEINRIVSNLMLPKPSKLPEWCKFSKNNKADANVCKSFFEEMELVKKCAMKLATDCSQRFSRYTLHRLYDFEQEMLLKIIPRGNALKLVMLELAFGSGFVPVDHLTIQLCNNVNARKKMQAVKYCLISSLENYYLILCNDLMPRTDEDFNLFLKVKAINFDAWGSDGPISNQKYRVASVDNCGEIKTKNAGIVQIAKLRSFSECPLFIDPERGEKTLLVSALFFDYENNIKKYLKRVK